MQIWEQAEAGADVQLAMVDVRDCKTQAMFPFPEVSLLHNVRNSEFRRR